MKNSRLSPAALGIAALLFAAMIYAGFLKLQTATGKAYFNTSKDQEKLRNFAEKHSPIIAFLNDFHGSNGKYPDDLMNLEDQLLQIHNKSPVIYTKDGVDYTLYTKLNMDGGLYYFSSENLWYYDPGNNEECWIVETNMRSRAQVTETRPAPEP